VGRSARRNVLWQLAAHPRTPGAFEAPEVRAGALPTRAHLLHPNGQAFAAVLVLAVSD
jgi:hypothetical protein